MLKQAIGWQFVICKFLCLLISLVKWTVLCYKAKYCCVVDLEALIEGMEEMVGSIFILCKLYKERCLGDGVTCISII